LLLVFFFSPNVTNPALADTEIPKDVIGKITYYADKYKVSANLMHKIIACESGYDTDIQSKFIRPDGSREQSFGLVQIYLPAHPTITKEQAIDPDFALEFLAKELKAGNAKIWSCYHLINK